ncbi:hypothetical protein EVAR_22654_1 [Eumeta japonica]|uniref:Uncharacterized protein n=1 Tax=Eumeta variegata TaxID=151549 RepID=A0A4C1VJG5_EUMVA|nr:hypothetical protein EVAR_22654_1 [Eumeta japonica]
MTMARFPIASGVIQYDLLKARSYLRAGWLFDHINSELDTALAADVEQMPPEPLNQNREGNKNHDKDCEVESGSSRK